MQSAARQQDEIRRDGAAASRRKRYREELIEEMEPHPLAKEAALHWNWNNPGGNGGRQQDQSVLETPSNQARPLEAELSGRRTVQPPRMLFSECCFLDGSSPYSKAVASEGAPESLVQQELSIRDDMMVANVEVDTEQTEPAKAPRLKGPLPYCNETGLTALRRMGNKPLRVGIEALDALLGSGLSYPSTLEVFGSSSSGKTEFMLNACCQGVLPATFQGTRVGGDEASFVFFCLGSTPSHHVPRLVSLLDLHARSVREQAPEDWIKGFVLDSLSRIHFVVCNSKLELHCSIRSLGDLLDSVGSIRGIMFDSLSIFQWSDKAEGWGDADTPQRLWDATFHALQQLAARHDLVVFASRWLAARAREDGQGQANDQHSIHLGKRWKNMVTHRLWLSCSTDRGKPEYFATLKRPGEHGPGKRVAMLGIEAREEARASAPPSSLPCTHG